MTVEEEVLVVAEDRSAEALLSGTLNSVVAELNDDCDGCLKIPPTLG